MNEISYGTEYYSPFLADPTFNQPACLATLVEKSGSSYRPQGAKALFVPNSNQYFGLISGGCIEQDLLAHSELIVNTQKSKLITYDLRQDQQNIWDSATGCPGILYVLLEPLTQELSSTIIQVLQQRKPIKFSINKQSLERKISISLSETENTWNDSIYPPVKLTTFGKGPDALILDQMAKNLSWDTLQCSLPVHFDSMTDDLWNQTIHNISQDPLSALVIMTHHYPTDKALLSRLLTNSLPYIGLLGAQKRSSQLYSDLNIVATDYPQIHSPAGIQIFAPGPSTIALSILCQIQNILKPTQ